ncbi:MAG TPA: SGNH/GDSL hydrolase family protein [Chthoniobacteraceae bacterium]|nr:SGNH/GDSL hydrolase family protein [Chthoniobacteraceae bacterium]
MLLPQRIYTIQGRPCRIRFENLVYTPVRGSLLFDVEKGPGAQYNDFFLWQPEEKESTPKELRIALYRGADFQKLEERVAEIWPVGTAALTESRTVRWLAIGDSLTANGNYISAAIRQMAEFFPTVKVIPVGTQTPKSGHPEIRHEGRPGWSWKSYTSTFLPEPASGSPFVYGPGGVGDFDFARYLKEQQGGEAPEVITLFLGVNDLMGMAGEFSNEKLDGLMERATAMVTKIREAAPGSFIGVVIPPPPGDQSAFGTNYGNGVTEWQYRRALQRYSERLLKAFDGRWAERIDVIPAHLDFDPGEHYPRNEYGGRNALHPRQSGYEAIAEAVFHWMAHLVAGGEIRSGLENSNR